MSIIRLKRTKEEETITKPIDKPFSKLSRKDKDNLLKELLIKNGILRE